MSTRSNDRSPEAAMILSLVKSIFRKQGISFEAWRAAWGQARLRPAAGERTSAFLSRRLKDATVKRYFYETHDELRAHLGDFVSRIISLGAWRPWRGYPLRVHPQNLEKRTVQIHQQPGLSNARTKQPGSDRHPLAGWMFPSWSWLSHGPSIGRL